LRVLFVDSDADTCTLFALLLGECRAIVHTAHTVSAARQIGSKSSVDVLITEVRLRDGDGCDLLDDLRRSDPHLRAAALTASLSRYDAERIRAAGFTLHLHKPVDIDHLVAVVATLARP
jgi:CheY-like chemotaxis protein